MEVLNDLEGRAARLAVRLADPDVDDAGLELNDLVRDLSRVPAERLVQRRERVANAIVALGDPGVRVCAWLARNTSGPDAREELQRRNFWSQLAATLDRVPA